MKATTKLEAGVNSFINEVLTTFLEIGNGQNEVDGKDLVPAQKETCTLIAGMLTGVKVTILQAGAIMNEMELGDIDVG